MNWQNDKGGQTKKQCQRSDRNLGKTTSATICPYRMDCIDSLAEGSRNSSKTRSGVPDEPKGGSFL